MSDPAPDGRLRPPSHFASDDHWYVACLSADLSRKGDRPVKRTILGSPLVLFRDAEGRAAALVDRCPHRNAPLSFGRIRPDDRTLECGYHGWRFDGAGRC